MSSHREDRGGDGHVGERIADVLEGRLTRADQSEVEDHLRTCPECAADLALARFLREEGVRRGTRHLSADRVLLLATEAPARLSPEEAAHLATCESCREEIALEQAMPAPVELLDLESPREAPAVANRSSAGTFGGRRWLVWAGAAAAVVAAVLFSTLVNRDTGDARELRALARIEALPVELSRSSPDPGSFEEVWSRALEQYGDREYVEAAKLFERGLVLGPDRAEVHLYLGSARLLLGEYDRAADTLRRATELAPDAGNVAEESQWQLANACLAAGWRKEAEQALRVVATTGSVHATEAGETLSRLPHPAR